MWIKPSRALHLAIWVYTAAHLLLALVLPLAAHEAHYALYARDLQLSYLDHPPLVAWLQSLMLAVSSSDFALRVLPVTMSVVAQYLLARLARETYPQASPWLEVTCVLILQGTLVFHGSMTLSPDAPLLPLGLLVVLQTLRTLERNGWRDWLVLGALIGLAGLAKYTAVTLAVSLVLALVLRRGVRGLLEPRLWFAGATALLLITPVLWWNWQHDWATVRFHSDYQFEDVERWSWLNFLVSSAEQLLYYSPLLVIGGATALWHRGRHLKRVSVCGEAQRAAQREVAALVFPIVALLAYLVTALESRASPHWSMLGWILLIPLLARWLLDRWADSRTVRALTLTSLAYSLVILLALPLLAVPVGTWPDYRHPARQLYGWEAAARHAETLLATLDARGFDSPPVILARNWHHAGLLAWYAPEAPVRNLFTDINPHNARVGKPDHTTWGVLVYPRASSEPRMGDLTRDFDCQPLEAQPVYFGSSLLQVFHYYACYSKIAPQEDALQRTD